MAGASVSPDMSTQTYTLSVWENGEAGELIVELRNEDGLVEEGERVAYEDYSLASSGEGGDPDAREREVTTDATRLDLRLERSEEAFEVRVLGDSGVLARERIDDDQWGLVAA